MAVILDTNAVSALLAGDSGIAAPLEKALFTALPVIVMGEYRSGLLGSRHANRLTPLFEQLMRASRLLSITPATTECYAEIFHELKLNGRPIPQNDLWIAALALEHGLKILSRDTHFDYVSGISRLGW